MDAAAAFRANARSPRALMAQKPTRSSPPRRVCRRALLDRRHRRSILPENPRCRGPRQASPRDETAGRAFPRCRSRSIATKGWPVKLSFSLIVLLLCSIFVSTATLPVSGPGQVAAVLPSSRSRARWNAVIPSSPWSMRGPPPRARCRLRHQIAATLTRRRTRPQSADQAPNAGRRFGTSHSQTFVIAR